jgi:predicted MFS family arabinose efflux permease
MLFALTYGMLGADDRGWGDGVTVAALATAAVTLLAFILVARRAQAPMLPLGLFRRGDFTAAQLIAFGISASVFAGYLYLTIYLQTVVGLSPIQTGLAYLPGTIVSFLVAGATATVGERHAPRTLLGAGLLLAAAGLLLLTLMLHPDSSWVAFEPGLVVAMAGVGLVNPVLSGLALGALGDEQSGLAAGANDTFRQGGIAIGVAVLGALIPAHPESAAVFVTGLHHALLLAAGVLVAVAVAALRLLAVPAPADAPRAHPSIHGEPALGTPRH